MRIHAITTGAVKITANWMVGQAGGAGRLINALLDRRRTDWLPIYCYVIEHPEGLIVVDTGIPANANDPILFPPWMLLLQRATPFRIAPEEELGPLMRARGLAPEDVRWVVQTHLHPDHEGGLHHFPNAQVLISRAEWRAAQGLAGRLAGYRNNRWPRSLAPVLADFETSAAAPFPRRHILTRAGDVQLVPTPGHSAGHMSLLLEEGKQIIFFAGDASYSQDLLLSNSIDGVAPDPLAQQASQRAILRLAQETPTVYLPSHEWDAERRLLAREPIPPAAGSQADFAVGMNGDGAGDVTEAFAAYSAASNREQVRAVFEAADADGGFTHVAGRHGETLDGLIRRVAGYPVAIGALK
jgi:glyoxylase-like metal-dependent hydrolase (beta-lactamase superfamily II)